MNRQARPRRFSTTSPTTHAGPTAPSSPKPATGPSKFPLDTRRDALAEVEGVVRVVRLLHRDETLEVRSVVRVLPRVQVRVDVVLIRETGDVRPHRRIEVGEPL